MTENALYVDVTGRSKHEIQMLLVDRTREGFVLYSLNGPIPKVENGGIRFYLISRR